MKKLCLLFALLILITITNAQSIVGTWKTIDDETGKAKSHVEIYEKDGKYYGKIVHIIDQTKKDDLCTACDGYKKDKKILGMEIIEGLVKDGDEYSDGTIYDPKKGKEYDCKLWVDENGDLQVRGYWGWFFRTQTWKKVK